MSESEAGICDVPGCGKPVDLSVHDELCREHWVEAVTEAAREFDGPWVPTEATNRR